MDELNNIPPLVLALFALIILIAVIFGIFRLIRHLSNKSKTKRLLAEHEEVLLEDSQHAEGYVVGQNPQEIYDHGYNDGFQQGYSQGYSDGHKSRINTV